MAYACERRHKFNQLPGTMLKARAVHEVKQERVEGTGLVLR